MSDAQGYRLDILPTSIAIIGGDAAGAFYAVQLLAQLADGTAATLRIPAGTVQDRPAFPVRGFMHDTGRNFQSLASLKAQLARFAAYRLNVFHWHLTDTPAWRVESRIFPQLNDPRLRQAGRNPECTYTFAEIRDLISFARERHIRVIPELDMPGHSAYFPKAMGFAMHTAEGMAALERLIDEFCAEIPASDCPWLHLGSDEVHIPDATSFMARMLARVRANGRIPMVWNPGLPGDPGTISQLWHDEGGVKAARFPGPVIDSAQGYLNSLDGIAGIRRYFFHQPCYRPQGDAQALGGILCCWPDVRVGDAAAIFRHSPVWPGVLAFAEALWCGRADYRPDLLAVLPVAGTPAWEFFAEFEDRLISHRDRFFAGVAFPYARQSRIAWQVLGPLPRSPAQAGDTSFPPERSLTERCTAGGTDLHWWPAQGGTLLFRDRSGQGLMPTAGIATAYAMTCIHAETACTIHAMMGFDSPGRANRQCGGIPAAGSWCGHGGQVWLNGQPLAPPAWQKPGTQRFLTPTWGSPANELPLTDEEFTWTRTPVPVPLAAGWNTLLFRVPCGYIGQCWGVTCIPVRERGGRWVEDDTVRCRGAPEP